MIWFTLSLLLLVLGHVLWLVWRGGRLAGSLLQATSAAEVLKTILAQRRFYFIQCLGSLIALFLLLGVKAGMLFFQHTEPALVTTIIFGSFTSRFLIGKLGCLGVVLLVVSLTCLYHYIKSRHYFDVLYALRDQLGLGPEPKIPSVPPLVDADPQALQVPARLI